MGGTADRLRVIRRNRTRENRLRSNIVDVESEIYKA